MRRSIDARTTALLKVSGSTLYVTVPVQAAPVLISVCCALLLLLFTWPLAGTAGKLYQQRGRVSELLSAGPTKDVDISVWPPGCLLAAHSHNRAGCMLHPGLVAAFACL